MPSPIPGGRDQQASLTGHPRLLLLLSLLRLPCSPAFPVVGSHDLMQALLNQGHRRRKGQGHAHVQAAGHKQGLIRSSRDWGPPPPPARARQADMSQHRGHQQPRPGYKLVTEGLRENSSPGGQRWVWRTYLVSDLTFQFLSSTSTTEAPRRGPPPLLTSCQLWSYPCPWKS